MFLMEKREDILRRQDERTGRQAFTDETKNTIMMDMCPAELERHLILNSDRYDTHPKVKRGIMSRCVTSPTPWKWTN